MTQNSDHRFFVAVDEIFQVRVIPDGAVIVGFLLKKFYTDEKNCREAKSEIQNLSIFKKW